MSPIPIGPARATGDRRLRFRQEYLCELAATTDQVFASDLGTGAPGRRGAGLSR